MHKHNEAKPAERLLRIREVAEVLGLSERLVWKYLRQGKLMPVRFGRATRVRWTEVERLIREGCGPDGRAEQ